MSSIKCNRIWKFGDNVDTDAILPAQYLNITDMSELAQHCMESINPSFASQSSSGDIVVAGRNFGSGSSREQAPIALKGSGIAFIIAESFSRIFFRNCVNIGLSIIELPNAVSLIDEDDVLFIDLDIGKIHNNTKNAEYSVAAHPPFMQNIVDHGGLINLIKTQLADENKDT